MTSPMLFSPIKLGSQSIANRIMISPMCQYSGHDGNANAWHMTHLGSLAISGAGLLFVEATAVSPEARITHGCLGLYNDANEAALKEVVDAIRAISPIKLAIQLGHAGRKASSQRPWEGGALIPVDAGGWQPLAPSALPHKPGEAAPTAMTEQDIAKVVADFVSATKRARALGFDVIELHLAHGYLLHEFLSPLANQRTAIYSFRSTTFSWAPAKNGPSPRFFSALAPHPGRKDCSSASRTFFFSASSWMRIVGPTM